MPVDCKHEPSNQILLYHYGILLCIKYSILNLTEDRMHCLYISVYSIIRLILISHSQKIYPIVGILI